MVTSSVIKHFIYFAVHSWKESPVSARRFSTAGKSSQCALFSYPHLSLTRCTGWWPGCLTCSEPWEEREWWSECLHEAGHDSHQHEGGKGVLRSVLVAKWAWGWLTERETDRQSERYFTNKNPSILYILLSCSLLFKTTLSKTETLFLYSDKPIWTLSLIFKALTPIP